MTGNGQLVAWSAFFGLVLLARLLMTRPAQRLLRPRLVRLAEWWMSRPRRLSDEDVEFYELWAAMRRQELSSGVERLRRIVATDESMSATRQIANRIAYRQLLHDLAQAPDVLPDMPVDDALVSRHSFMSSELRPGSTVEVLEIGWRR